MHARTSCAVGTQGNTCPLTPPGSSLTIKPPTFCLSNDVDIDVHTGRGTVIANITCVPVSSITGALSVIGSVLHSPYAFCNRFILATGKASIGDVEIPENTFAVGTVCSLTMSGLLRRRLMHARPCFGGLVEIDNGVPKKFSAFLSAGESLLAPVDDFLYGAMTSVLHTLQYGSGEVLASFVEISASALPQVRELYAHMRSFGLGGKILVGMPNQPLLGMPVSIGWAGMVIFRDINIVAALHERGIPVIATGKTLLPFEKMHVVDNGSSTPPTE